jgi:hypothetical protein
MGGRWLALERLLAATLVALAACVAGGCVEDDIACSGGLVLCLDGCYDPTACTADQVWDSDECRCTTPCLAPREVCGGRCLDGCGESCTRRADCVCGCGEPPDVEEVFPANRAEVDHEPAPDVWAKFSIDLDPTSCVAETTVLMTNQEVITVTYDGSQKTLHIGAPNGYDEYTTYKITLKGGEGGIRGSGGVPMLEDFSWKFYTQLEGGHDPYPTSTGCSAPAWKDGDSIVLPRTGLCWDTYASGGSLADPSTSTTHTLYGVFGQPTPLRETLSETDDPCDVSLNYTMCGGFIWHMQAEL